MRKSIVVSSVIIGLLISRWASAQSATTNSALLSPPSNKTANNNNPYIELLLTVTVNGEKTNDVVTVLQTAGGQLLVSKEDLQNWRLTIPKFAPIIYQGKPYFPLQDFSGVKYQLDISQLTLNITVPPETFPNTEIAGAGKLVTPTVPSPGGFINYNVVTQNVAGVNQTNALFTAGYFNRLGNLTSNFLVQTLNEADGSSGSTTTSSSGAPAEHYVRLNSTWDSDFPGTMKSLRFGDAFSAPGMWGQSVDFGGIQYASNFTTQPGFITFPLPSFQGSAVVPSVTQLLINNAVMLNQKVPPGPFSIQQIPVLTGAGTVNIVTTNILGQQQVVSLPYYASNQLLKPGLSNYSYEAGFIRQNFGITSNDYGQFMMAGTDSVGITSHLTTQWHAEVLTDQQTAGYGIDYLIKNYGVINAAVAGSNEVGTTGMLGQLGFQHQALSGINYGVNAQMESPQFVDIGFQTGQVAPIITAQSFISFPIYRNQNIAFSYTLQRNRQQPMDSLFTASYSQNLGHNWSLSLTGLTNISGVYTKQIMVFLTRVLGSQTSLSTSVLGQKGNSQENATIQRALPLGSGYGYNLSATNAQQFNNYQESFSAQNSVGTYTFSAAQQRQVPGVAQNAYQAQISGGVAIMGGSAYLSRNLGNSFAVVQVPGYPHVGVYSNNQLVGYTNKQGDFLVPNLLPYQENPLNINATDLPLNTQFDYTKLNVIPYNNAGVIAKFDVTKNYSATMRLVQANGQPVPAGAQVSVVGSKQAEQFPVVDDGVTYVTGLTGKNDQIIVQWDNNKCGATLDYHENPNDPIPDLGTITCK